MSECESRVKVSAEYYRHGCQQYPGSGWPIHFGDSWTDVVQPPDFVLRCSARAQKTNHSELYGIELIPMRASGSHTYRSAAKHNQIKKCSSHQTKLTRNDEPEHDYLSIERERPAAHCSFI